MKPRIPGAAFVLAASLCFSTGGVLMKFVPWNPLAINGVRNAIACLVIGLYILATRHRLKFNLTVLIGAEGDFSPAEVEWALANGYKPVSLGAARLRTETAAIVACHTVVLINE